ncbi:MAG: peptide deformylase [Simkaniaceae bacterium]
MKLKLAYYGSKWLRKRAKEIDAITPEIRELAAAMIDLMNQCKGVGIAANQVERDLRIFITKCPFYNQEDEWIEGETLVYINPKIISHSDELVIFDDGCLSIPGVYRDHPRPKHIQIEALDLEGQLIKKELSDFEAFNFMHELDHLNGVLFIDRLDQRARKKLKPQLQEIKKKYSSST